MSIGQELILGIGVASLVVLFVGTIVRDRTKARARVRGKTRPF